MTREHRQAYMEGFGAAMLADDYREQTAELSQEFSQFGGKDWDDYYDAGRTAGHTLSPYVRTEIRDKWGVPTGFFKARISRGRALKGWQGKAWKEGFEYGKRNPISREQRARGIRTTEEVFGPDLFGSDFKTIDPACYAPGGAPGCEFGAATLKSKGWKRGPHGESYTKTINGYPNTIQMLWPIIEGEQWQGDNSGELTKGFPTPSAVAAELERWGLQEQVGPGAEYFGRMGVPAGMQLPGSWGVPHASMVRPGETPEGWDPNLFRGFGGRFDKAALRKQREDFKTIYRDADIDLRKATDRYHANPTLSALTQVRKFGNRRNKAWKKMMKIQGQLGNKGLPFVAPVEDPWWNQ